MSDSTDKPAVRQDKPRPLFIVVEVSAAVSSLLWVVAHDNLRALIAACVIAIGDGARSSLLLVFTDPGTAVMIFAALARIVLLTAPLVRALTKAPRHRFAWIPLLLIIWIGVFGTSVPAFSSVTMWLLLVAASVVAWFVCVRRYLFAASMLPWLIALEPLLGHSPLGDSYWSADRLMTRCASNDGVRAIDMRSEYAVARYFGVTPVSPNLVLASGERRSFWVRRDADGTPHLGQPLPIMGNAWQGCVRDGTAWLTNRLFIWEVPIPRDENSIPEAKAHRVEGGPELGIELDYVDTICPAKKSSVYSTQLIRGGYLEYDSQTDQTRFHAVIDGLNLQMNERSDGLLIGITTSRLVVFDPRTDRVIDVQPAGMVAMGIDICRTDGAIAVTDFVGRVRFYEIGSDGRYVFVRGGFAPAARRVSFSPDCSKIAVTSGNDRNLFILKRSDLSIERSYSLGPGLRDIVFLDDRWIAAADACVVNFIDSSR